MKYVLQSKMADGLPPPFCFFACGLRFRAKQRTIQKTAACGNRQA
jgi:hypothetical protein